MNMRNRTPDSAKILLVEDEDSMAIGLDYNLSEEGYQVVRARDGREALELFHASEFDLVLLDLMLPYRDGFEITEEIRKKSLQIPILILTARTAVKDRVKGLSRGADDYMTKPFHLDELLLRIHGMLRRKTWYKSVTELQPVFRFGENEINFEDFTARRGTEFFRLTYHEATVLRYFIQNRGRVISRKELLENVWRMQPEMETRTIDNFISRLRKYFEKDPSHPQYIKSIRSAGYLFSCPE